MTPSPARAATPWIALALLWPIAAGCGNGAVEVDVAGVARQPLFRSTVTASGEIVATRYAEVGSSVMGRIVELLAEEGARVESGQIIARIDAAQARSSADAAAALVEALEAEVRSNRELLRAAESELEGVEARAAETRRNLTRTRDLHEQGIASGAQLDAAGAAAEAIEAELRAARAAATRVEESLAASVRRVAQANAQQAGARDLLDKTEIVAPIAGKITRLNVREGEMVVIGIQNQPGTTLMTISDMSSISAEVKVAEADVLRLQLGQPATVTLEAAPGRSIAGRVSEIGASALPTAGTGAAAREFRVVVELDDATTELRPGLTCDAEIVTDVVEDALTVPLQAVVLREVDGVETTGVFALVDGAARFRPVESGIIGGIDIEVSGVGVDTPIVIGPISVLRELTDGARVSSDRASG